MPDHLKRALRYVLFFGFIGSVAVLINVYPAQAQQARDDGYRLQLGELMNESMQVHHTKLWFAGHAGNWPLAAYEVDKLKETIEQVKETIVEIQSTSAKWKHLPVGMLLAVVDTHLDELAKAVKAKNPDKFDTAYHGLTAACNACHTRAGQTQIKIMVPLPTAGSTFVDQDFTLGGPKKPGE